MIVCICHRVSDRDIARAAQAGCGSFDDLQFELGVATACGRCLDCARETFLQHTAAGAPAASWPGCSGQLGRGVVIPVATPHRREPTTPAVA